MPWSSSERSAKSLWPSFGRLAVLGTDRAFPGQNCGQGSSPEDPRKQTRINPGGACKSKHSVLNF